MSDNTRNKYCVIGASQSGKTRYVLDHILPSVAYDSVILCGNDHNIEVYRQKMTDLETPKIPRDSRQHKKRLTYLGVDDNVVLDHLITLSSNLASYLQNPPRGQMKKKETLVIFDDFVNPKAIKDQRFISFLATCRHALITVVYVCHNVDVVLTPFMKTNMTHFIVCQSTPSRNFNEFMHTFLDPLLSEELMTDPLGQMTDPRGHLERMPTEKEIRELRDKRLHEAFNGRFGKLIIAKERREYLVIPPSKKHSLQPKKSTSPDSILDTDIVRINTGRYIPQRDKRIASEDPEDDDDDEDVNVAVEKPSRQRRVVKKPYDSEGQEV